jgi:hypothetical protein
MWEAIQVYQHLTAFDLLDPIAYAASASNLDTLMCTNKQCRMNIELNGLRPCVKKLTV